MHFFSFIKSYFYSKEQLSSKVQLQRDFGEYPPHPLADRCDDLEFNIIKTRGLGGLYNFYTIANRAIQSNQNLKPFQLDLISEKEIMQAIDATRELKTLSNRIGKYTIITAFAILLPFISFKFRRSFIFDKNKIGFYLPIPGSENQISTKITSRKATFLSEAVISHEHIHFLQFKSKAPNKKITNLDFLKSNIIYSDKYKAIAEFFTYAFNQLEVEARLHEVVLTHYRIEKNLPMHRSEFIHLLLGFSQFHDVIITTLKANQKHISENKSNHHIRDKETGKQLRMLMTAFGDEHLVYLFIFEVLPIMYGNLLRYYGDDQASFEFIKEIERPNFYDEIYQ